MNFEKIRAGISTGADVGVFIGFVMIAFQLQQNTVALDTQAKAAMTSAYSAAETTIIGDAGASALALSYTNPAEMTDSQIMEVWAYYAASLQPSVTAFQAYKQKVISRADYLERVEGFAVDYLTVPSARIVWTHSKDSFPPDFAKDVDLALSRVESPDKTLLRFEAIRRDLAGLKSD